MWEYVILVWLTVGAGYWIIKPLLGEHGNSNAYVLSPDDVQAQLNTKKEGAYATIRELEFDLKMGKLSEDDFQILKQQYLQEAAGYMKEIDDLKMRPAENTAFSDRAAADEIEGEGTAIRAQKHASRKDVYCAVCGQKVSAGDNFCGGCGNLLKEGRENLAFGSEDFGEET